MSELVIQAMKATKAQHMIRTSTSFIILTLCPHSLHCTYCTMHEKDVSGEKEVMPCQLKHLALFQVENQL